MDTTGTPPDIATAEGLFQEAINIGAWTHASDWHFTPDQPVAIRVDGVIKKLPELQWTAAMAKHVADNRFYQEKEYLRDGVTKALRQGVFNERRGDDSVSDISDISDFEASFVVPIDNSRKGARAVRARVHVKWIQGSLGFCLRQINDKIPTMDDLKTPGGFRDLLKCKKGLVLVCGETGSGKSTTLAAAANWIAETDPCKIVTYEKPIEYLIPPGMAIVEQHSVGTDIRSFQAAIGSGMREDPDKIILGELRDPDEILAAIRFADTGHLVLSTLHTGDVVQSVTRLVDSAPASAKSYYRQMLSASLRGVLCQRLLPCKNGGRVAAYEFMRVNNVIKGQIYGDTAIQIKNSISQAVSEGMFLLHRNLAELFTNGQITEETAIDALEHSDEEIKQYRNQLDVLKKDKQKFNSPIKK